MTQFSITNCDIDDAPALARICVEAMWTNASWVLMWKDKTLDYVISQAMHRVPYNLLRDEAHRHQKAVDVKTGKIIGYTRWSVPDIPGAQDIWTEMKGPSVSAERFNQAKKEYEASDWEYDHALDVLDEQIDREKERLTAGHQYFVLDQLAVDPKYWGRGIGTMLVQRGIREADEYGLDIFIHGTEAGSRVYSKVGCELAGQVVLDDKPFGGAGEYSGSFWIRRAKKL